MIVNEENVKKSSAKDTTGRKTSDFFKSPIKPLKKDSNWQPTPKPKSMVIRGLVTILIGLLLYPITGLAITVAIAIIGIIILVVSVLVRVEDNE